MGARFVKNLKLLNRRLFSICSRFKWEIFLFLSTVKGQLFKQPKIEAENIVKYFITISHLFSIFCLSSLPRAVPDHYCLVYTVGTWFGKATSFITLTIKQHIRENICYFGMNVK
jgi:hypothetical protein